VEYAWFEGVYPLPAGAFISPMAPISGVPGDPADLTWLLLHAALL
jgi:hypothetical protein